MFYIVITHMRPKQGTMMSHPETWRGFIQGHSVLSLTEPSLTQRTGQLGTRLGENPCPLALAKGGFCDFGSGLTVLQSTVPAQDV